MKSKPPHAPTFLCIVPYAGGCKIGINHRFEPLELTMRGTPSGIILFVLGGCALWDPKITEGMPPGQIAPNASATEQCYYPIYEAAHFLHSTGITLDEDLQDKLTSYLGGYLTFFLQRYPALVDWVRGQPLFQMGALQYDHAAREHRLALFVFCTTEDGQLALSSFPLMRFGEADHVGALGFSGTNFYGNHTHAAAWSTSRSPGLNTWLADPPPIGELDAATALNFVEDVLLHDRQTVAPAEIHLFTTLPPQATAAA